MTTQISHRRDSSPLSITIIIFEQVSDKFLHEKSVLVEQFACDLAALNESTKVSLFIEDILEEHDGRIKHYNFWFTLTFIYFTTFRS